MSGVIAVFVKTPGLSPVKSRLAVSLGDQFASSFHLASAGAVASVVKAAAGVVRVRGYFAVAEQEASNHAYWSALPCLWQGEGGLGERMARVYHALLKEHDYVILIGADIPQVTAFDLLKASDWLEHSEQARFSFGPSSDGGFWLFGGNRPLPLNIWTDVTYSEVDTGSQFHSRIERLGDIQSLTVLTDVDKPGDLFLLHESLHDLATPLPEQIELIRLLDALPLN